LHLHQIDDNSQEEVDQEEDQEYTEDEYEKNDLPDFDVTHDLVTNFICDKIKGGKYLTNLLYVNQTLSSKGFEIDKHQAYIFDSNLLISDR